MGHIKGPVERDVELAGATDEPGHPLFVQGAFRSQNADYHTIRPQVSEAGDLLLHLLQLRRRVEEISKAGPDQDVDLDGTVPPDLTE